MSERSSSRKPISSVRGTHDVLPEESRLWQRVESIIRGHFELYGYREIRTPVFEATELFEKGTGQTSDIVIKEMYTFTDKGGRSLTLRPEYTPSVVRALIEHRLFLRPEPLRFYFIGPMFRHDKPQKGRYRQFHQADIEVFGEKDPAVDAEIVEMADSLLGKLGVRGVRILVNSLGCRECRPAYLRELRQQAASVQAKLCPDCQRKVRTNALRIFDCKEESCRKAAEAFPHISDFLCSGCSENFLRFRSFLDLYGIAYSVEPRLVRGIDYYTRVTFEVVTGHGGSQNALLGGGRYDNLVQDLGGPDLAGTGFALGLERLLAEVNLPKEENPFLYVAYIGEEAKTEAVRLARYFRRKGMECLLEFKNRNLKAQLGRASKLAASWALILGEEELASGIYTLKNMKTGRQDKGREEDLWRILKGEKA